MENTISKEEFTKLFNELTAKLNVSNKSLSLEFDCGPVTVDRWKKGLNSPSKAMRPVIIDFLRKLEAVQAPKV